jgi:hypothetical protein
MERINEQQEQMLKARAEVGQTMAADMSGGISTGFTDKRMNDRERLLNTIRNQKETLLRQLTKLQAVEDKIHSLRLAEAEAVQALLDALQ